MTSSAFISAYSEFEVTNKFQISWAGTTKDKNKLWNFPQVNSGNLHPLHFNLPHDSVKRSGVSLDQWKSVWRPKTASCLETSCSYVFEMAQKQTARRTRGGDEERA